MNSLLLPLSHQKEGVGVYARQPLLPLLLDTPEGEQLMTSRTRLAVAFGSNDWLRTPAAERACAALRHRHGTRLIREQLTGGHHVYLDDPEGFAQFISDGVKAIS